MKNPHEGLIKAFGLPAVLRSDANVFYSYQVDDGLLLSLAADRISALEAENAKLRYALEYLVEECDPDMDEDYNPHAAPLAKARAALSEEE